MNMQIDRAAVKKMWLAGVKRKDIAQALGCSEVHVHTMVDELGLPRRQLGKVQKKIADTQQFREMWDSDMSTIDIGNHYRVSAETVRRAARTYGLPMRPRGAGCPKRVCGPRPGRNASTPAPKKEEPTGPFGHGTYAEIRAYAEANKISQTKALQMFHQERRKA